MKNEAYNEQDEHTKFFDQYLGLIVSVYGAFAVLCFGAGLYGLWFLLSIAE